MILELCRALVLLRQWCSGSQSNQEGLYRETQACGCVCEAVTPQSLKDAMRPKKRNEQFRADMAAGKIKSVATRAEYLLLPWRCEVCKGDEA